MEPIVQLTFLPAVNASLNGLVIALLLSGLAMINRKRIFAHKMFMLGAFAASCLFLVCYVTHYVWRASVKGGAHTPFAGEGVVKMLYYLMLISHIVLAMVVPVLAIWLIRLGLSRRYDRHRRVARIAYPIWMYVSVTGVLIYFALYHWNPAGS